MITVRKRSLIEKRDPLSKLTEVNLNNIKEKWIEQYSGEGNIVIEIWSKLLVLEAEKI
ncbi:hypothetical protein QUF99_05525 [Bacillus sp. DX4.1]|uniref:YxiG family protein n=1 Tax=Bacillus sp. DX4.1 TaxID=3055867 RepID=UPI0025A1EFB9|nr:hypothetical protein [Bacillus sp. DX4.1]MDM5186832.1 hypothetical protein [Bacillus sp. DX4.1]